MASQCAAMLLSISSERRCILVAVKIKAYNVLPCICCCVLYPVGVSFTCPPMAEWVHYCNERNMCGTHVCKDRNGDLVQPSPGKRQAAVAAAAVITPKLLAASAVPSKSQSEGSAGDSESEVSAAGVAPMAFTSVPNASKDPFLSKLDTSQQSGIFLAFNPPTAAGYQMTVSRWCAALLFALDRVVSELQ